MARPALAEVCALRMFILCNASALKTLKLKLRTVQPASPPPQQGRKRAVACLALAIGRQLVRLTAVMLCPLAAQNWLLQRPPATDALSAVVQLVRVNQLPLARLGHTCKDVHFCLQSEGWRLTCWLNNLTSGCLHACYCPTTQLTLSCKS